MPSLKQLTCNVIWTASGSSLPLEEYGTTYKDGIVETFIAVPEVATPFAINLKSDGYIAPGLSMFVYIDGVYQCNRGRNNLKIPNGTTHRRETNINFLVRQKEDPLRGGHFLGSQWTFGKLDEGCNVLEPVLGPKADWMDTIEVVVLRSAEGMRGKAPKASASESHPVAIAPYPTTVEVKELDNDNMMDFGGLFDGSSDEKELCSRKVPFGGDMAWDDNGYRHEQHSQGRGWNTPSRSENQRQNTSMPRGRSSSVVSHAATPAIIINLNQPAVASPSPWTTAEAQPWNLTGPSGKDSWASTPVGPKDDSNDDSWQTWIKDAENLQRTLKNSKQSSSSSSSGAKNDNGNRGSRHIENSSNAGWGASHHRGRSSHSQSVPGSYSRGNQNERAQDSGRGWNDQGGNSTNRNAPQTSPQQGNSNWNNANDDSRSRNDGNGWKNDGGLGGNQDSGWNTNGGDNNNNHNDSGWASGGNDGNWSSGQDNQGNWGSNGNQSAGNWDSDHNNSQGDNGWNSNGQDYNNYDQVYNSCKNNNSGNDWNNANSGAQDAQASTGRAWNTTGNNQGDYGNTEAAKDTVPTTGGAFDPTKPRGGGASLRKARAAPKSLSKQASINAAHRNGRAPTASKARKSVDPFDSFPKSFAAPGAWPEFSQFPAGSEPAINAGNPPLKPYHLSTDAAGNPRVPRPNAHLRAPTPPLPPTADRALRVHAGEPVMYQHKTGSPQYIDTHDKPYAVFIFRYRSKDVIEQTFNISIPHSEDVEKAKLVNLSKEELIAEVIKTKSRVGSIANSSSTNSLASPPPSVNNFPPNGNGWAATLNDKLAALAVHEKNSSSSSSGDKNNQAWNNAPPGSPIANNGNTNIGAPVNGHAPASPKWAGQNNSNGNSNAVAGSNGNVGGGHVESWLDRTAPGTSVSGHKPWGESTRNGIDSYQGGSMNNHSRNWSGNNRGGSQKGRGDGGSWAGNKNDSNGTKGWEGGNNKGSGGIGHFHASAGASQKAASWNNDGGRGSQNGNWNSGGNNGGNQMDGWNLNGGGENNGGNGNGGDWNQSGSQKAGSNAPVW